MDFHTQLNCRMCFSRNLEPFFDLGMQPLVNSLCKKEDLGKKESKYPLGLVFCMDCNLVQLSHVVDSHLLFPDDYVYHSSGIPNAPHFIKYAEEITLRFLKNQGDLVVEIGSNDGHLLSLVKQHGARVLGVDPARNVAAVANSRGVSTYAEFFGEHGGEKIRKEHGAAQVVIGNNVVAHIDDHHDLLRGVAALLADDGVFVFEAPYLGDMFETLAFDSIYHEHMSYLALHPLTIFLKKFGFEIFDVKPFSVQGNSLRYYAAPKGTYAIEPSVGFYFTQEKERGFDRLAMYHGLVKKIKALKTDVRNVMFCLKKEGKRIAAYGAPARGNTLLNYFEIGSDMIEYATEALPSKIGRFTPGTHIPIVDIVWARENLPDYFLLLAWPYKNVILEKEKVFIAKGGKFIMPVGDIRIIP